MKRLISILFVFTLLLQAIPVLHFFCERSSVFYTNIDEDKPGETKVAKAKPEQKAEMNLYLISFAGEGLLTFFVPLETDRLPSPYGESLIRPPDTAC